MSASNLECIDSFCLSRLAEHRLQLSPKLGSLSLAPGISASRDMGYGYVMLGSFPGATDTCIVWPSQPGFVGHDKASRDFTSHRFSQGFVPNLEDPGERLLHPIWGAHIRHATEESDIGPHIVQIQSYYADYVTGKALQLVEEATDRLPGVAVCFNDYGKYTVVQSGNSQMLVGASM